MIGNSSVCQPRMSTNGSGALSHVYIQHPPIRCNIPETQGLYYDDANKLLLSPTSDQVLSWKICLNNQHDAPDSDSIGEGPILSIRYSLDKKIIGIQRSNYEIQFKHRETGITFGRKCKPNSESILGFFWSDCPNCDVIFIKTSGLDLFCYESEQNNLRLVETKKLNVSWYIYTHESRMVLLASGMQCNIINGFQFSSAGVIRIPKFELTLCKPEANQKPVLASTDIHIVTVYGRIYCLQLDKVGMILNLYRFYRDAVVLQGTLPIYSSRIAVSVVDNVVLVHQIYAKVVILYDIFLESLTPISAPLPLLLRGTSNTHPTTDEQDSSNNSYSGMIYGDNWTFLVPDLICDVDNGLLWKLYLDLDAIAASSSDIPSVLDFLQRRKSDPNKIKSLCLAMMRTIILERRPISLISKSIDVLVASYSQSVKMGNILLGGDRRFSAKTQQSEALPEENKSNATTFRKSSANLEELSPEKSNISDSENTEEKECSISRANMQQSSSEVDIDHDICTAESSNSSEVATQAVNVAISPDELYHFVFAAVEDEMSTDPSYLVSVVVEYLRSVSKEKFIVHPNVYVMMIQLLSRNNRHDELGLFIKNKIIEPSKEAALQLLDSGRQNSQTRKLGIEMLRSLSLHHDYVNMVLQDGCYLEALRYARKYKVITVRPSLFLEAAVASNNIEHLAAVLRFFSDFTPGFKGTSEHNRFHRVLTEMC